MKYEITDIRYVYNERHIPTAYFIAKDSFGFYFIKSVNVSGHSYTHYTRHYDYASAYCIYKEMFNRLSLLRPIKFVN